VLPGLLPLALHAGLEAGLVDGEPFGPDDVGREVRGEAEGVVEAEEGLAGDHRLPLPLQRGHRVVQDGEAPVEGLGEALLLGPDHLLDILLPLQELRVGASHHLVHGVHGPVEDRIGKAEHLGVAGGPAHDPAQHVAPPLVGRENAVADEKGGGPGVVGDDPHGDVVLLAVPVALPREPFHLPDDPLEKVGVVVGFHPLHDGADPLEPHAGVDGGLGKRGHGPVGGAVELHEDVVPDLHVAVTVAPHGAVGAAAPHLGAVVPEDLGAGAAGAGVTHGPEVVFLAETVDPLPGNPLLVVPDVGGLVVVGVDRHVEVVLVEPQLLGEELPGIGDGLLLEVVAEGEVAEHLEEGMVPGSTPHVLQVIVLAAGPHAFLGAGGPVVAPVLHTKEAVLELVHAGIGEEKGRVVVGDEEGTGDHGVAAVLEKFQKSGA